MASKILRLPPREEVDIALLRPYEAALHLFQLLAIGYISHGAFRLGANILQRMSESGVRQMQATGWDLMNSVVHFEGRLYAGAISEDLRDYVQALQELNFRAGLLSALTEAGLFDERIGSTHFTLSPEWTAGVHYGWHTPIFYRLAPVSSTEYENAVTKAVTEYNQQHDILPLY